MPTTSIKNTTSSAIVLLSGGLDSTACLWWAKKQRYTKIVCITFKYGSKEETVLLPVTEKIVELADVKVHKIISLEFLAEFSQQVDSSLIAGSKQALPTLHEKDLNNFESSTSSAKSVWIPARNLIFLSIASSYAEVLSGVVDIITGFNLEEGTTFPDNSKEFIDDFTRVVSRGVLHAKVNIVCPLVGMNKAEIVKFSEQLKLPFEYTSSCYNPAGIDGQSKPIHCGICESCLRRKRGFKEGNINDTTVYQKN